jgi:hypothetical protein
MTRSRGWDDALAPAAARPARCYGDRVRGSLLLTRRGEALS